MELFIVDDVNHHAAAQVAGISFISIDMNLVSMLYARTYQNIMQCYGTLALCLDINDIAVLQAVFFSGFRIQMHVARSDDNTLFQLKLAFRTDELSASAACDVATVADRGIKANLARRSEKAQSEFPDAKDR